MTPTAPISDPPAVVCTRCRHGLRVEVDGARDRECPSCRQGYRVDAVAIDVVPHIAPPSDWGARAMQSRWLAGVYESLWRPLAFGLSTAFGAPSATSESRWVVGCLGRSTGSVLDLSCGPGRITAALLAWANGGRVVGVDLSRAMLEQARERAPGAVLVRADAASLPFADETFAAVTNLAALDLYADAALVVAESARVLKRGGRWVASSFIVTEAARGLAGRFRVFRDAKPPRARKPTIAEIKTAAEHAGLEHFRFQQFRGYVLAWADKG